MNVDIIVILLVFLAVVVIPGMFFASHDHRLNRLERDYRFLLEHLQESDKRGVKCAEAIEELCKLFNEAVDRKVAAITAGEGKA